MVDYRTSWPADDDEEPLSTSGDVEWQYGDELPLDLAAGAYVSSVTGAASAKASNQATSQERYRRPTAEWSDQAPAGAVQISPHAALQNRLDTALDVWWQRGVLPSSGLLRDGLAALEAGADLDDAQRSLLLRTALARRKGMLTAVLYQKDPDLTAAILAEALVAPDSLPRDQLDRLVRYDTDSPVWQPILCRNLEERQLAGDERGRRLAAAALAQLRGEPVTATDLGPLFDPATGELRSRAFLRRWWLAAAGLLLLAAVVLAAWWFQRQLFAGAMVTIPAGHYLIGDGAGGDRPVDVAGFAIDGSEVTNASYRQCVERNACTWPVANGSATRREYFLDPAFGDYPVVNINWTDARRYCESLGRRLPTAIEWEVAASYAPATHRRYRYPWGDEFQAQRANSAATGSPDTLATGSFRPNGDSPWQVADMAGNVAEWTATPAGETAPQGRLVKGGSFLDGAAELVSERSRVVTDTVAAPWLGFRCAADAGAGRAGLSR